MIEIFVYDAAGNVTYDGQNYYLYDGEGNLCASQRAIGGMITQYIYDADGNRVAKGYPTNASATLTCADPANMQNFNPTTIYQDNQEYAGDGVTLERTHVNVGQDEDATIDGSGTIHYQLTDWLHNRRMQVSAAGVVEGTYANLPFGDGLQVIGDDSDHKHFTGKERDTETATGNGYDGLDYFGARYDSSNIGRWTQPDWSAKAEPIPYDKLDDPQTMNLYAYMTNNPLSGVDADGHQQCGGDCLAQEDSTTVQALGQEQAYNDQVDAENTQIAAPGDAQTPAVPAATTAIINTSATSPVLGMFIGALVGECIDPLGGGVAGALLGSTIGVGADVSHVPSTGTWYAGPTISFTPMIQLTPGVSGNAAIVPAAQSANSIANRLSFSFNLQPTMLTGTTVTYSPGNGPPVAGPSIGSRVPITFSASYNFNITPAVRAARNFINSAPDVFRRRF